MKYQTGEGKRHVFWMVWPYIHQLKSWIKRTRRAQQKLLGKAGRKKSTPSLKVLPSLGAQDPAGRCLATLAEFWGVLSQMSRAVDKQQAICCFLRIQAAVMLCMTAKSCRR